MSRRAWIGLGGALLLAFVGVLILVNAARSSRDEDLAGGQADLVVVATKAIPQGTPVANLAASVEERAVAQRDRIDGAIRDLAELDPGSVTGTSILPGEQLVAGRFVSPRALGRARIPTGLQEVSIVLAPERVVGGAVVPGDRVGMVFSFEDGAGGRARSQLTLQKILVTALQQTADDQQDSEGAQAGGSQLPSGSLTVTFAVTPSQATQIVYAAEFGSVWLTLQRGDTTLEFIPGTVDPDNAFAPSVGTS